MKSLHETVKTLHSIVEQGSEKRTHRVSATLIDPDHTAVSKRNVKIQRVAKVQATTQREAEHKVRQHYTRRGYKVHDINYLGEVK